MAKTMKPPKEKQKSLSRLSRAEADRFVEITKAWTVGFDESRPVDLSLKKKGWVEAGHTTVCIEGKFRNAHPVLEPVAGTYNKDTYSPIFTMEKGDYSGKWVLKT